MIKKHMIKKNMMYLKKQCAPIFLWGRRNKNSSFKVQIARIVVNYSEI